MALALTLALCACRPGGARAAEPAPPPAPAATPAPGDTARVATPPDTVRVSVFPPPTAAYFPAKVDSGPKHPTPGGAVLRSALIPGWGQAYNHSYIKAGLALAGVGFFAYKAWSEYQNELDAAAAGDQVTRDQYMNMKVNYIWWGAVVYLLQIADAYVDASLSTFDSDFGPPESELETKESPRLALAFRARF